MIIIVLFFGTSILPAFSFNLKDRINEFIETKEESYISDRFNETNLKYPLSYNDVMNPYLGYEEMEENCLSGFRSSD